jgi:hypothetical protein
MRLRAEEMGERYNIRIVVWCQVLRIHEFSSLESSSKQLRHVQDVLMLQTTLIRDDLSGHCSRGFFIQLLTRVNSRNSTTASTLFQYLSQPILVSPSVLMIASHNMMASELKDIDVSTMDPSVFSGSLTQVDIRGKSCFSRSPYPRPLPFWLREFANFLASHFRH